MEILFHLNKIHIVNFLLRNVEHINVFFIEFIFCRQRVTKLSLITLKIKITNLNCIQIRIYVSKPPECARGHISKDP